LSDLGALFRYLQQRGYRFSTLHETKASADFSRVHRGPTDASKVFASFRSLFGRLKLLLPSQRLMRERSAYVIDKYGLQGWFKKVPSQRFYHTSIISFLKDRVPKDAVFLETGCGIGRTFVLLAQSGFRRFIGIEKDAATHRAAQEFLSLYKIKAELYNDDGLNALGYLNGKKVDVYMPLNWTYEIPQFERIFDVGREALRPGGWMIVDIIRSDFVPATSKEQIVFDRYRYKRSVDQVRRIATEKGFEVVSVDERHGARVNFYLRCKS
jgi:SAM-dependent methyltransferase